MTYAEQLSEKSFIQVFVTTEACPIIHSDLLVFSYLYYQAQYKKAPTNVSVACRTGLDRNTITACKQRLTNHGLLIDNHPVINELTKSWFRSAANKYGFATWRCYTRSNNSLLSVQATSLLSFFYHCRDTAYKPRKLTVAYLAVCANLDRATVETCLKSLAQYGFVCGEFADDTFKVNTNTRPEWFADSHTIEESGGEIGGATFELPPLPTFEPKLSEPSVPVSDVSVEPVPSVSAPVVPHHDPVFSVLYEEDEQPAPVQAVTLQRYLINKVGHDRWMYHISNVLLRDKVGIGEWWIPAVDEFLETKSQTV